MSIIRSLSTEILDVPPSCIDACPWEQKYFAIGTYFLDTSVENSVVDGDDREVQKRTGSILLYELNEEGHSFTLLQTTPTDYAILDLHFPLGTSRPNRPCLWTANSTGSLTRHEFSKDGFSIESTKVFQVEEPSTLILSFAFHPRWSNVLGITLSDGNIKLCHVSEDGSFIDSTITVASHTLEAWTLNFDPTGQRILSGADDMALKCTTLTKRGTETSIGLQDFEVLSMTPGWQNTRIHGAGVTAILQMPDTSIAITGSYDDRMRVLDLSQRVPKVLEEVELGGGVWRLKLLSETKQPGATVYKLLASCMHAGARIVKFRLHHEDIDGAYAITDMAIVARFEEHESMNYGSEAVPDSDGFTILSTSFYDKRLCLWKYPPTTSAT